VRAEIGTRRIESREITQLWAEILGKPAGQGNPQRITTRYSAYPPHTVEHRNLAVATLADAWHRQHPGTEPLRVPVAVFIMAGFARPRDHYRTGRNASLLKADAPMAHTQAPDIDKLARLVLDALTVAQVIADDKYVNVLRCHKGWAHIDSTKVIVQWTDSGRSLLDEDM
jgi:crossover junction endodeoxyribonuclease RusA